MNCTEVDFDIIDSKLHQAGKYLRKMGAIMVPPRLSQSEVAAAAAGAIIHREWQAPFNDELTGFLTATRSVPELIRYRFGTDPILSKWVKALDLHEQLRREDFDCKFEVRHGPFRKLLLAEERNVATHREGVPAWEVRVK